MYYLNVFGLLKFGRCKTMSDMYEKICPLFNHRANNKCQGSQCAFANIKRKSTVDEDGNMRFVPDGWYCLVRDFLITISSRE